MGLETHIEQLKIIIPEKDRVLDNQWLLNLRISMSNNNHKDQKGIGQYDELIKLIDEKLKG